MTPDLERRIDRKLDIRRWVRAVLIAIGGGLCNIGWLLAWPGQSLGNFGVWVMNIGCDCPICREERESR